MQVIIFTKDRAMQLDCLLRSMKIFWPKHPVPTVFVHNTDEREYQDGYHKLNKRYNEVCFISIKNDEFRPFVLSCLENDGDEHIMFLVDDNIFINHPFLELPEKNIFATSNRLSKNINYCYSCDHPMTPPEDLVFDWRNFNGDFGYPVSIDGNIFRKEDILSMLKRLDFVNPNQMEAEMIGVVKEIFGMTKPMIKMSEKSSVVGIVANRVQDEYKNRHGNLHTPKELNDLYLENKVIDILPFMYKEYNSCHVEEKYTFEFYNG